MCEKAVGWVICATLYLQRMIEMAQWGDDSATIEKQIMNHNRTLTSLQRSQEVDRARDELVRALIVDYIG